MTWLFPCKCSSLFKRLCGTAPRAPIAAARLSAARRRRPSDQLETPRTHLRVVQVVDWPLADIARRSASRAFARDNTLRGAGDAGIRGIKQMVAKLARRNYKFPLRACSSVG